MLLLLQLPPALESDSVSVLPGQIAPAPVIATGFALTVKACVAVQPVGSVYVIVVVPALTAVTTPVVDTIVAIVVSLLVQLPPEVASISSAVLPAQADIVPVIADGLGLTVTNDVA